MAVRGLGGLDASLAWVGTPAGSSRAVIEDAAFVDYPSHVYGTSVAPTRVSYRDSLTTNTSPQTTSSFDVQAGDLIVIMGYMANEQEFLGDFTWTGTGLVTPQDRGTTLGNVNTSNMYVSTIGVTATATARTVTATRTVTGDAQRLWGFSVTVWRNHGGVGNITKTVSSGAPSLNISTSANSAIEVGADDWNAVNATSRTWRSVNGTAITEDSWYHGGVYYDIFHGYAANAGVAGLEVVGLTAPANTMSTMAAVEVLAKWPDSGQGFISQPHTLSSSGAQIVPEVTEVTYGSISTSSGTASTVITKPSGTVDGDGLIAIAFGDTDDATMSAPAGWTLAGSFTTATYIHAYVWTKVAASEGASYTFSGSSGASHVMSMMRFQGVNTSAPLNVSPVFNGTLSTSASQVAPTITTTVAGAMMVSAWGMQGGGVASYSVPTGMTERADFASGDAWLFNAVDTQLLGAAGATGTRTTTTDVRFYTALSFAVAPAVLVLNKSGTGAISQTHTVTSTGNKLASGTGAISVTHAVTSTGNQIGPPAASGTGAISQTHTLDSLGTKVGTRIVRDATNAPGNNVALTATNIPSQSVTGSNGTFFQDSEAIWWYRQNLPSGTSGQWRMAVTNSKVQAFGGRLFIPTPSTFSINRVILTSRWASGNSFRLVVTTARQLAICNSYSPFTAYTTTAISGGIDPALKYYVTLNFSIGVVGAADNTLSGDSNITMNVYLVGSDTPISTVTASSVNLGTNTITHYDVGSLDTAATAIDLRWTNLQWENDRTLPIPDLITVGGTPVADGTGTIDQTSDVTSTGFKSADGTSAISQTNTVTSTGSSADSGTGAISQTSTLTCTSNKIGIGTGVITQTSTLTCTSGKVNAGTGVISQTHTVTCTSNKIGVGTGVISVTHTLTCTSSKIAASGTGAISVTHTVTGDGVFTSPDPAATLQDDFSFEDDEKWLYYSSASIAVVSGRLQILAANNIPIQQSRAFYDLTGSEVAVEVTTVPNVSNGSTEGGLYLIVTRTVNDIQMFWTNGSIAMRTTIAGVESTTYLAYNVTAHRYWRIRESGGSVYFDTSSNRIFWTNRRIVSTPFDVTRIRVGLFAQTWNNGTNTGYAEFDNLNFAGMYYADGTGEIEQITEIASYGFKTASGTGTAIEQTHDVTCGSYKIASGTSAITQTHDVTSTGQSAASGTGVISVAHAVTSSSFKSGSGTGLISQTSTVTDTGFKQGIGTGVISQTHTLVATSGKVSAGTGIISQTNALTSTGIKYGLGTGLISQTNTVTCVSGKTNAGTGLIAQTHGITSTGDKAASGTGLIAQTHTLDAVSGKVASGTGEITQTHTITSTGETEAAGTSEISQTHDISSTGWKMGIGSGSSLDQSHIVTSVSGKVSTGTGLITVTSAATSTGIKSGLGVGAIPQSHTLDATKIKMGIGTGVISQTNAVTSTGNRIGASGTGAIVQTHTIVSTGHGPNMVTNPSVVLDTTWWGVSAGTGGAATGARVLTGGPAGIDTFYRVTQTVTQTAVGSGATYSSSNFNTDPGLIVTAGDRVVGTAWVRSSVTQSLYFYIQHYNAAGAAVTTGRTNAIPVVANEWTLLELGGILVPPGATDTIRVRLLVYNATVLWQAGDTLDVTGLTAASIPTMVSGTGVIAQSHALDCTAVKMGLGSPNLLLNPGAEDDTQWTSNINGVVRTFDTTEQHSGLRSALQTRTTTTNSPTYLAQTYGPALTNPGERTYTFSIWGMTYEPNHTLAMLVQQTTSGVNAYPVSPNPVALEPGVWAMVSWTLTIPATVQTFRLYGQIHRNGHLGTVSVGQKAWLDDGSIIDQSNPALISQTHTLTSSSNKIAVGTGVITQTHTITSTGDASVSGTSTITQVSDVTSTGVKAATGTGEISQSHVIVSVGEEDAFGFGAISQSHTLVSTGIKSGTGTSAITQSHTLTCVSGKVSSGTGAITQTSAVTDTGWKMGIGVGAISQTHTLTCTSGKISAGTGTINQTHAIDSTGWKLGIGTGAISQTQTLTTTSGKVASGTGTISQICEITSAGAGAAEGTSLIIQSHDTSSTGYKQGLGTGAIAQTSTLTATSGKVSTGTVLVTQSHTITSTGNKSGIGTGLIAQTSTLTAVSGKVSTGTVLVAQTHTVTSTGWKSGIGTGTITQTSTLVAVSGKISSGTGTISQSHTVTSTGNQLFATHSVFDPVNPPAPVGYYEDGVPRIRLGSNFYTYGTGVVDWVCSGGRLYIPENTPCIGQPVGIYAWVRTYTSNSTNPPDLSGDTPIAQGSTVMQAGWNEVNWEPFEFNPADAGEPPQMVFIGYEMFGTAVGGYVFVSEFGMGGPDPVFAQDGSHLVLAEADALRRSAFEIGGGDEGNSSAWYGTDIVLSETALIQRAGNGAITQSHTITGEGSKLTAGTGSISQTHSVVSLGLKTALATGAISGTNTITSTGFKQGSGTGTIGVIYTFIGASGKIAAGPVTITQTHTVTSTGLKITTGTGAITQANYLTSTGASTVLGVVLIEQTNVLTSTGFKTGIGTGQINQNHLLDSLGESEAVGQVLITQSNTVTSTGLKQGIGTSAIAQSHTLTGTYYKIGVGTSLVAQSILVTSTGTKSGIGTGLISQAHTLTCSSGKVSTGTGLVSQTNTVTSTGAKSGIGFGTISQSNLVTSTGLAVISGTSEMEQTNDVTGEGIKRGIGTGLIAQSHLLLSEGVNQNTGQGLIVQTSTVTGEGTRSSSGTSAIEQAHEVTSEGAKRGSGTSAIAQSHTLTCTSFKSVSRTGVITQATNTVTSTGNKSTSGTGLISQTNTVTCISGGAHSGTGAISQAHTLVATSFKTGIGTGLITQSHTVVPVGGGSHSGNGQVAQPIEVTGEGIKRASGTSALTQNHFITSEGQEHSYGTVGITQSQKVLSTGNKTAVSSSVISLEAPTVVGLGTKVGESSGLIVVPHTITGEGNGLILRDGTGLLAVPHLITSTGSSYHLDWVIIKGDTGPGIISVKTNAGVFPAALTIKQ